MDGIYCTHAVLEDWKKTTEFLDKGYRTNYRQTVKYSENTKISENKEATPSDEGSVGRTLGNAGIWTGS